MALILKIAIHHNPGSFSDRWIAYCKKENIPYVIVDAFSSNIMEQLRGIDVFMWHHHHGNFKDILAANNILFALEHAGIHVFPDFKTNWHFDDKVGQKYLLEGINAPFVPSYVFYEKKKAMDWARQANYPIVFKLRGGAGSANVQLVKRKSEAFQIINRAFGRGFSQFNGLAYFKDRYSKFKEGNDSFLGVIKGLGRLFITPDYAKKLGRDKGYVYFQDFIPNNNFDLRVVVVGKRAFALKRIVRKNDFRASGSGKIVYEKSEIDIRCVQIAFAVNRRIEAQSIAFDFVFTEENSPLIVEISYGYAVKAYDYCPGYWDDEINWYPGQFNPQEWMLEDLVKTIKRQQ